MSTHSCWPAWMYGPNGQAAIFQSLDEVPPGWSDSPATVTTSAMRSSADSTLARPAELQHTHERAGLEADAVSLGLRVDGRWSDKRLRLEIERARDGDGA